MIVIMSHDATAEEIETVSRYLSRRGYPANKTDTGGLTGLRVRDADGRVPAGEIRALPGVLDCVRESPPYRLAARERKPGGTVVEVKGVAVGGKEIVIAAGPCAVESEEQAFAAASVARKFGAKILRGGAFKPRSSPYYFQGISEKGLAILRRAADEYGLSLVTEVIGADLVDTVAEYADILQVGSRNMDNYHLLKKLARAGKPVLLKRGIAATVEEFLLAAEYILSGGNGDVILCERGIRTVTEATRNTLDVGAIAALKGLTHLPVICDPSHAAGSRTLVAPLAASALAAGADGLLVEIHPEPLEALSDGMQSLDPPEFEELVDIAAKVALAVGRSISGRPPDGRRL